MFLLSSVVGVPSWMIVIDVIVALLLAAELGARLYAEPDRWRSLRSFWGLADLIVIASLLLPVFVENLAFLRIVRALRLLHSYHLLRDLRGGVRPSPWQSELRAPSSERPVAGESVSQDRSR